MYSIVTKAFTKVILCFGILEKAVLQFRDDEF